MVTQTPNLSKTYYFPFQYHNNGIISVIAIKVIKKNKLPTIMINHAICKICPRLLHISFNLNELI